MRESGNKGISGEWFPVPLLLSSAVSLLRFLRVPLLLSSAPDGTPAPAKTSPLVSLRRQALTPSHPHSLTPFRPRTLTLLVLTLTIVSAASCRRPDRAAPPENAATGAPEVAPPAVPANDNVPATPVEPPLHIQIDGPDPDEEDRWLFAQTVRDGAPGGWAEGSFVPERNRIVITTHDLTGFSIDFSRLAIDWDRLVVLRIDGYGSEFRRRRHPIVRFEITQTGDWQVIERD